MRPENRLIREKKRDKSMAFGHWKQKYAVRPGNCKIPGLTAYFIGCRPENAPADRKMIKIFQKTGLTAYFIGCRPEASEYRAAETNTTTVQKAA
ncbi:MAG: hypothetical protein ACLTIG_13575 [Roseburia hominis]